MPQVLPPSVRTYKPRRGRVTPRQQQGLAEGAAFLLNADAPIRVQWPSTLPLVLEIGFGTGEVTATMAAADPHTDILAIDVHTPGVGDLLGRIVRHDLANVRVIEGDALDVLEKCVAAGSLAGVRSYFPDPWQKARHAKRRLVQPAIVELIATKLQPGGTWWIATDWAEYADVITEVFEAATGWSGGVIPRPDDRPLTRYERRGISAGRSITDFAWVRTP